MAGAAAAVAPLQLPDTVTSLLDRQLTKLRTVWETMGSTTHASATAPDDGAPHVERAEPEMAFHDALGA